MVGGRSGSRVVGDGDARLGGGVVGAGAAGSAVAVAVGESEQRTAVGSEADEVVVGGAGVARGSRDEEGSGERRRSGDTAGDAAERRRRGGVWSGAVQVSEPDGGVESRPGSVVRARRGSVQRRAGLSVGRG